MSRHMRRRLAKARPVDWRRITGNKMRAPDETSRVIQSSAREHEFVEMRTQSDESFLLVCAHGHGGMMVRGLAATCDAVMLRPCMSRRSVVAAIIMFGP